jgi:glycosyltransferase involved in cell wall biosynthesis
MTEKPRLRVCYFGTYRANYSRNRTMIEGLRRNGVEVIECHRTLWRGIEDRVQAAGGGWLRPSFLGRVLRTYGKLLLAYRKVGDFDVMVIGYPGQADTFLARALTWIRRKPLVLDVFMSIYLIACERGLVDRHPLTGRLIYSLEKLALRLPDLLIQDTAEYVDWLRKTYGLDSSRVRFRLVPTGADDRVFRPVEVVQQEDCLFLVLYYGTFIPNHGVEYIVEAARLLKEKEDIRFEFVGRGPTKEQAVALARDYGLRNVTFADWIAKESLSRKAAAADVLLGVFGTTPQSMMTVQNKVYEGLAMGKPVVTGDAPTIRQTLVHGKHVYLCERANPRALADALLALKHDPGLRRRLSENGYRLFRSRFDLQHNGARFAGHLKELVRGCH